MSAPFPLDMPFLCFLLPPPYPTPSLRVARLVPFVYPQHILQGPPSEHIILMLIEQALPGYKDENRQAAVFRKLMSSGYPQVLEPFSTMKKMLPGARVMPDSAADRTWGRLDPAENTMSQPPNTPTLSQGLC